MTQLTKWLLILALIVVILFSYSNDKSVFPRTTKPYTPEQAAANGDVVQSLGPAYNLDRWKLFLSNLDSSIPDQVRVTMYTTEGDPIFHEFVYDGSESINYTYDNSMDGFGHDEKRPSTTCKAIEVAEPNNGYPARYVLTGCEDEEIGRMFWYRYEGDAALPE